MSKSHWNLCVPFFRTAAGLCIYHLFVWSNFNFLHISQWIPFPTQSCLILYSFCANLLHSLIIWLMASSLSPHSLHLLFCCVLSILVLIWLVLIALFCAAIRRDSVSLLRFPFLSHVQVFSCEMHYGLLYSSWSLYLQHFGCCILFKSLSVTKYEKRHIYTRQIMLKNERPESILQKLCRNTKQKIYTEMREINQ